MQDNKQLWAGRIIGALISLFLAFGAIGNLARFPQNVEGAIQAGYPESVIVPLGVVLLVCVILYVIPRTAVLGAILLTAWLGGAVATHVRLGEPFWLPVVFGVLVWLALFLRDSRLRNFIPLRRE